MALRISVRHSGTAYGSDDVSFQAEAVRYSPEKAVPPHIFSKMLKKRDIFHSGMVALSGRTAPGFFIGNKVCNCTGQGEDDVKYAGIAEGFVEAGKNAVRR